MSAAARETGVSRQTGSLWVSRARESGIALLEEAPRRPRSSPARTCPEVEARLLEVSLTYPFWGPRKVLAAAYPGQAPPVCERTASRILERMGRRAQAPSALAAPLRFERSLPNELWQMDFKMLGPRRARESVLSVLDDATRFAPALRRCPDQTFATVKEALWETFGGYGLPEAVLTDNGPAFRNNATWRWSSLDLWLLLLGVRSLHSKPYHPQTQGKVERFHGTMEREGATPEALEAFRSRYNWVRPHEALGMVTPGSVYAPSPRKRPARMPEPWFPESCAIRRTDVIGKFSYQGRAYRAGIAFARSLVGIIETDRGPRLCWGDADLGPIEDLLLP